MSSNAINWGIDGLRATMAAQDAVDITHAGTGEASRQHELQSIAPRPRVASAGCQRLDLSRQ